MSLTPWYKVIYPRDDLRENRPLDASEFAVHLDQVRDGRARADYQEPQRFFERTFLTQNLSSLASEVLQRLAGKSTETSAVFNLTTQFGGGKTHALTLLYHLARQGSAANNWFGVGRLLEKVGLASVPQAAVAVFVGTEFDSLTGRGGTDGTPLRRTPWGEIAYQLGGEQAFAVLAEHERQFIEPKGDVIRAFLPKDRPVLILMDEIVNYVSTYRKLGYHNRLYNFIQSLSETARGRENVVLVVSLPASEMEYTADDEADQQRFEKMLDRLGKAVMMSAETETAEIIRRRLFEWDLRALSADGRVMLPQEARQTCDAYAEWILEHRSQLPGDFPIDRSREVFAETFPFHPTVFSVFERKWQALPRFQRTRGVLRLMALWAARAYQEGYRGAQRDSLIGIGSAPLEDPTFRAAVFEQLGENRLEAAVTTDIAGKKDAHALRMDEEAVETIRKTRLHRKVATAIFFESNGGQQRGEATVTEIRLAVSEPDLDIGNVETVLEALRGVNGCYYLIAEGNRYRFGLTPNLNKLWADRRANIPNSRIDERVREEIEKVFKSGGGIERIYFPEDSGQIPDRAILVMIVLAPEHSIQEEEIVWLIDEMTRQAGSSGRTFKSALLWMVAEDDTPLQDEARKLLAWEVIEEEHAQKQLQLDETQERQLQEGLGRSRRDLREAVWRQYKNLVLLDKENELKTINLGLVHSSAAESLVGLVLNRLRQMDEVVDTLSPNFLLRNWIANPEWSTRAVRDAFFASPRFPRLTNSDAIRETIARGVSAGLLGYVGKSDERYQPFIYNQSLNPIDVEISEDLFIIPKVAAESYLARAQEKPIMTTITLEPGRIEVPPGNRVKFSLRCLDQRGLEVTPGYIVWSAEGGTMDQAGNFLAGQDDGNYQVTVIADQLSAIARVIVRQGATQQPPQTPVLGKFTRLVWHGTIPSQKWMNFYTKVLARFATGFQLKLQLRVEVSQDEGISTQKVDETRAALHELGLEETIQTEQSIDS
jgi:hypothetical protein